jgi:hypothetical protein
VRVEDTCTVHDVLNELVMRSDSLRLHQALATIILFTLPTYGCGDDSETNTSADDHAKVQDKDKATSSAPSLPAASSTNAAPTPPATAATTNTAPASSATVTPAPSPTLAPTSTGGVAPTPPPAICAAGSLHETEPNDTPATANALGAATSFCGSVGVAEVDYVSFTLPSDAKGLAYSASWSGFGTPTLSLTSEGITTTAGQKPPFNPGKSYVFKVTGGAAASDYVVAITIQR